jgi:hypothetical protein
MSDIELFYSYSHKDEALKDQLVQSSEQSEAPGGHPRMARPQNRLGHGMGESDRRTLEFGGGDSAVDQLRFHRFGDCHEIEMKRAMERHESGDARVIPVILRSVDWSGLIFSKLQAAPKDGAPVTKWADRDEAFMNVAQAIRAAVAELTRRKKESGAKSKARFFMPSILTAAATNATGRSL